MVALIYCVTLIRWSGSPHSSSLAPGVVPASPGPGVMVPDMCPILGGQFLYGTLEGIRPVGLEYGRTAAAVIN